ncbi:MAG: galactokinase [Bacteroidetes bacterium]|nr:MAG: galactokinase [Bacteroidota bacterium]
MTLNEKVAQLFVQKYGQNPLVVQSPGRINLIGEHTDYNQGFVLPAAIDKKIVVALQKRNDDVISLTAVDFNEDYEVSLADVAPLKHWPTYPLGVVHQLQTRGYTIGGFNMIIDGDVPVGAGLSSSAAVECATIFALDALFNLGIGRMDMALMAQQAEHNFSGVKCGIMDMFASLFGKKDQVVRLDCRSLEYEYAPLELGNYKLLLFNTNVKHSLASSAYNERRQQCEQGVAWVQAHHPEVASLRDVSEAMLAQYVLPKDALVHQRCHFVVSEIARVQQACLHLAANQLETFGAKMFETHFGLSKQYAVSCPELDFLVEAVQGNPAVLGARMMGGGFGGCTINIVHHQHADALVQTLAERYQSQMHLPLTVYAVQTANGTGVV